MSTVVNIDDVLAQLDSGWRDEPRKCIVFLRRKNARYCIHNKYARVEFDTYDKAHSYAIWFVYWAGPLDDKGLCEIEICSGEKPFKTFNIWEYDWDNKTWVERVSNAEQ